MQVSQLVNDIITEYRCKLVAQSVGNVITDYRCKSVSKSMM